MKRSGVTLAEVADWHQLHAAFLRAARGKQRRPEVLAFAGRLDEELARLREEILALSLSFAAMTSFRIHDPKPRLIHAPCFRERVLHHALIAQVGPVLDRALVDDTFACRVGKGALAATRRAQHHLRRHPWFAQIDIRAYFPSIDHACLLRLLNRRFKNPGVRVLMERIVGAHRSAAGPGRGLPIGALTSQHFANTYLAGVDRLLLEGCGVAGMVRYMDDIVWWGESRAHVRAVLARVREYLGDALRLELREPVRVGPSAGGLNFVGYRILPGAVRLSRRRKRRYGDRRRAWELQFLQGRIDALTLQQRYSSALAITVHAEARAWRREQIARHPLEGALCWL